MQAYVILILLWVAFGTLHSVLATETIKNKMQVWLKNNYKYYRITYSLLAFIILVVIVIYHISINSFLLWQNSLIEQCIALVLMITGFSIMLSFIKKFFFDLSGADVFLKKRNESIPLLQASLYKYVRHPLYSATLLFTWSIFLYHPTLSNLVSNVCITTYTIVGIYFEEKKLINQFGDSYIEYKKKTPMLLPALKF